MAFKNAQRFSMKHQLSQSDPAAAIITQEELPVNLAGLLSFDKNSKTVRCQNCNAVILKASAAQLAQRSLCLPEMQTKAKLCEAVGKIHRSGSLDRPENGSESNGDVPTTKCEYHWLVEGMEIFENVGFANPIGKIKYLICIECEKGPIGWHDTSNENAFYISTDRVKHADK